MAMSTWLRSASGSSCSRSGETVRLHHPAAPDADVYGPGVPIVFSDAAITLDQPPPGIGEHNQEVYGDLLGYSHAELQDLQAEGVI